eukprot:scaffold67328_cov41-Cyclotella_meneghiniana.AAC.2
MIASTSRTSATSLNALALVVPVIMADAPCLAGMKALWALLGWAKNLEFDDLPRTYDVIFKSNNGINV